MPDKIQIKDYYDSDEADILETYAHRLQDKIHVSYTPGAFGDLVIGAIFLSVGQSEEEILKRAESEILDTGGIGVATAAFYNNNNLFKCSSIIDFTRTLTRLELLAIVYYQINHTERQDLDYDITIPDDTHPTDRIPVILSHCYGVFPQLINCMKTEFNQKLILIKPITNEDKLFVDYMHQVKHYKLPISELVDDAIGMASMTDSNMSIVEADNNNILVISVRDFINSIVTFRECVCNMLEFAKIECDESNIDSIVKFRNLWLNKQKIKELNGRIEENRNTLAIKQKMEENNKFYNKVEQIKPDANLPSKNINNFTIFGNNEIVKCNESKSILVRYLATPGRVDQMFVVLNAIVDLHKWVLHIDESEEAVIKTALFSHISPVLPKLKNVYLYTSDVNLESNLKILNWPGILFGGSIPYILLERTRIRRNNIFISNDTQTDDTKKFIFQNNRVINERTAIMNKIFEHNIENCFHLSWLIHENTVCVGNDITKLYFDPTIKMILDAETLPNGTKIQDNISSHYNRALIDIFSESIPNTNTVLETSEFIPTQLSIQVLFATEKTWKPIFAGKPFLGFTTMYYYKWLKSEGWETYDNIFDYSFDEIEDDKERLNTWFENNIMRLSRMSIEQVQSLIKLDADKIERNKNKALCYKLEIPDSLSHFISSGYFGQGI